MSTKKDPIDPNARYIYNLTHQFLENSLVIYEAENDAIEIDPDSQAAYTYTKSLCAAWQAENTSEATGARMVSLANDMCDMVLATESESLVRSCVPPQMRRDDVSEVLAANGADALAALCRPKSWERKAQVPDGPMILH